MKLPIETVSDTIIDAVTKHAFTIIEAPTGSGKSTRVPSILLDAGLIGNGEITILQPRRLAARMLARRVAGERRSPLGKEVGYRVRFDNQTSPATRICFETDGISLRRLQHDPFLSQTSIIILDEFHERHLYADVMLGMAKQLIAARRPDLKLVVMSATLNTAELERYLPDATIIQTEGRTYPVAIRHMLPNAKREQMPPWQLAAESIPTLLQAMPEGNILVFMPGFCEINRTIRELQRLPALKNRLILPLHGSLSPAEQDRAVAPSAQLKVIVSTNIAETSLTIDGVTAIIDSGLVRRAAFDPRRGINTLLVGKTSQASAAQRAGRAGRTAPGIAFRLWTERDHDKRPEYETPELLRMDLAETMLQLKHIGMNEPSTFPWITPPTEQALSNASKCLQALGALDKDDTLTPNGQRMAAFPLHPRISRMLLAGEGHECIPTLCLVAALIQEKSILLPTTSNAILHRRLALIEGQRQSDLNLMIAAWQYVSGHRYNRDAGDEIGVHVQAARAVGTLQEKLIQIAECQGLDCYEKNTDTEAVQKAVLTAFSDRLAVRTGGHRCSLSGGKRGSIHAPSIVPRDHRLFVAMDIQETSKGKGQVEVMLSQLLPVEEEWLTACCGEQFTIRRRLFYDAVAGGRVAAEAETCLGDLIIRTERLSDVTPDEAAGILAIQVINGTIVIKAWNAKVESWLARINLVAQHCAEFGVPAIHDGERIALLEQICHGAMGAKAVKSADVWSVLRQWLSPAQTAAVEAYAPEKITIENGRTPRIHYDDPAGPYLAMRVQELYDTQALPTICNGKVKLKVRILAPNQRPVQITDDLAHFWQDSYEQIKKDLRGRYPKHEWR